MRKAHIIFLCRRSRRDAEGADKTEIVAGGDTCDASTLFASTHQLFSEKCFQKSYISLLTAISFFGNISVINTSNSYDERKYVSTIHAESRRAVRAGWGREPKFLSELSL
jgi:hypothetical protein